MVSTSFWSHRVGISSFSFLLAIFTSKIKNKNKFAIEKHWKYSFSVECKYFVGGNGLVILSKGVQANYKWFVAQLAGS
jgi:hypothetical protein